MLNNNNNHNHNSSCVFAEEIVSYLYEEANVTEKFEFETHLKNCLMCSDELTSFGFVRSSINEWHKEEIFAMEMPQLEIPITKTAVSTISTTSGSRLDNLRELFAWFPTWKMASVALAVLIVGFAFGLFFINSSNDTDLAANNIQNPAKEEVSSPTESKPRNEETVNVPASVKPEVATSDSSKDASAKIVNSSPKHKTTVIKSNDAVAQNTENKEDKKNKNLQKQDVPKLTVYEEDEDKSIRLADLFAEIDTK